MSNQSDPSRRKYYPSDVKEVIAKIKKNLDSDSYGHLSDVSLGMLHRELTNIETTFENMVDDHGGEFMTIEIERQSHLRMENPLNSPGYKLIKEVQKGLPTDLPTPEPYASRDTADKDPAECVTISALEARIKTSARKITDDAIQLARLQDCQVELKTALEGMHSHEDTEECKSTVEEVQSTDRDQGSEG